MGATKEVPEEQPDDDDSIRHDMGLNEDELISAAIQHDIGLTEGVIRALERGDEDDPLEEEDEFEEDDFELPPCALCDGPVMPIGVLGGRQHYRCRNCGMDFSREIS